MSLGILLAGADDAVIWRGPMKMGAIKQLIKDVEWGELDYLVVDSPPGTGDEPLSIVQVLKDPDGAVVVTTPQELSVSDVRRSIRFCEKVNLPVLGVVENMSGFVCPHCKERVDIFKSGGGEEMSKAMNTPFLGRIPIDPDIVKASDEGEPFVYYYGKSETARVFETIVQNMIASLPEKEAAEETSSPDSGVETSENESASGVTTIAIPVVNGEVSAHFGHAEQFSLITLDPASGSITSTEEKTPPPHEPGVLPQWLREQKVDVVLAGGMGQRARSLLEQHGIRVVVGIEPAAPEAIVKKWQDGTLETGDNICDH
jgi:predicted Fe-Mo cluster-binding NifX family protein